MNPLFRILLDPQGGPEGGGGSSSGPDLQQLAKQLLAKNGDDATAVVRMLLAENYEHRDAIRSLKAKAPSEGSVVLSGDDAKDWAAYRELGKPSDLRKAVTERDQFKSDAERFGRAESYDDAASKSGLNPKAFRRLAEQEKLQLETKDIRADDGKLVPTVHVKGVADGKETLTPLSEYIDRSWSEFKPALYGDGQKVEPSRPGGMPARRDPNPSPPPQNGGDPSRPQRPVGHIPKPM